MKKILKKMITGILVFVLAVPFMYGYDRASAEETQIDFAKFDDGTLHENTFELARDSEDESLSSYEEKNGKHWVKLFSKFDGDKNIFDDEDLPDDTAKLKVVFEISNYDIDNVYPLTWATGIDGWASGKPTGISIDKDGTYEAVLDIASEEDGIGRTISAADISSGAIQLVFQLGEADEEGIANVKKTTVSFKACYAYEEDDDIESVAPTDAPKQDGATEAPVETVAPAADNTAAPDSTVAPVTTVAPSATNVPATGTPSVSATVSPSSDTGAASTDAAADTSSASKNPVKKIKISKKSISLSKKKSKTITFKLTTSVKGQKTTDKIKSIRVSNKKIIKVVSKKLTKNACKVKIKGLKKGNTTLTVKVGKKSAKVKVIVK